MKKEEEEGRGWRLGGRVQAEMSRLCVCDSACGVCDWKRKEEERKKKEEAKKTNHVYGIPPRSLLALEQQYGLSGDLDEDEVLGLVCDADSKVVAHDAVPRRRWVRRVETLLDASGDVLHDEQTRHKPASRRNASICETVVQLLATTARSNSSLHASSSWNRTRTALALACNPNRACVAGRPRRGVAASRLPAPPSRHAPSALCSRRMRRARPPLRSFASAEGG